MRLQRNMSSIDSGEENVKTIPQSNTGSVDNMKMDSSEKMAELVPSPKVQVMTSGAKDIIDVEVKTLDEGIVYRIEYQDSVYGVEKLSDGKIAFYEVVD